MTRLTLLLWLSIALLSLAGLVVGPADIPIGDGLWTLLTGGQDPTAIIMREIRLPRVILAAAIGYGLGLSGAAIQGYLRNPLAEPGLLGISGSAALGAVIALQTGLAATLPLMLPVTALAGSVAAVATVLLLAGPRGSSMTLILAGIAISAFAGALTSLALNLSPNPFAAAETMFWMMGSVADRSFVHVVLAVPFIAAGAAVLLGTGAGLDALTLGEDAAHSLGMNLRRLRLLLVVGTAASVGAGVAVAGAIGFVGLVVPHVLRPLVSAQPSRLLPASGLGGAAMVLAADLCIRLILPERDLKLGVLTALVGAPIFLHLIYRTRRGLL